MEDVVTLFLPSSVASSGVITNTVSHYTTTLRTPIQLPEGYTYEAALIKLIYPCHVDNVIDGSIEYWSFAFNSIMGTSITNGEYSMPTGLQREFNTIMAHDSKYYVLTVDASNHRYVLQCKGEKGKAPYIKLSKNLQSLTKLPEIIQKTGPTFGSTYFEEYGGMENMYVYVDFLHNTVVGDTVAPILNAVAFKGDADSFHPIEYEPINPIYMPLSKTYLDTITVEIRTKTGEYFPFISGESLAVLHIRARSPKL